MTAYTFSDAKSFVFKDCKFLPPKDKRRQKTVTLALLHESGTGGYSIVCLSLPGCSSQGRTVKAALRNIQEAFIGCIESYEADGLKIPFKRDEEVDRPRGWEVFRTILFMSDK